MALQTNIIAAGAKLKTMRFVAIAAGHPSLKHSALNEGAVFIDLALDLPVWKVKVVVEQRNTIIIAHRLPMYEVLMDLTAARMTSSAHPDFPLAVAWSASLHNARGRIRPPYYGAAFVKRDSQAFARVELPITLVVRPSLVVRPFNVIGTRTVTSFACYIDLCVRGRKGSGGRIVIPAQIG